MDGAAAVDRDLLAPDLSQGEPGELSMDGAWDVYLGHSLQAGVVLPAAGVRKLRPFVVVTGAEVLVGLALVAGRGVAVAAPAAGVIRRPASV
jgi:hypothetical protein